MKTLTLAAIRCSLMCTAVAAFSLAHPASANLITNPGFETGDFTGWAHVGGRVDGDNPHSGNFAASFNTTFTGHEAVLQQSVATTPGAFYTISFFLAGGGLHSSFVVSWGGETLFFLVNENSGYSSPFVFIEPASDPSTELLFQFQAPFGVWYLDDVSVGVPDAGSTVSLLGCGLLGLVALRRRLSC